MKKSLTPHFKTLICDSETPVTLYAKLALSHQYAFLLESAESRERVGRYSVIGFDPLYLHVFPAGGKKNPLTILQKTYNSISFKAEPKLPRLQAPFVGYFSYEVARHFEKLTLPLQNAEIPDGIFFLPKNLLIFDHEQRSITAIAYTPLDLKKLVAEVKNVEHKKGPSPVPPAHSEKSAPRTRQNSKFESLVMQAKEKIAAGEIFQIVLCQVFSEPTQAHPLDLYRRLRLLSPSPYMYYLQYPDFSIIGSSPETLVRTEDDEIIIRPIAGTRRRGKTPQDDIRLEVELKNDSKEQAEHMMLVDLGRNDVGRVAREGTVHVTQLMEVEKYSHVMHLVSEVRGQRTEGKNLFDIFQNAFPAGTLSGAPKIRAMEIIADLEKQPRGIYGGAVGYFDLSGNMDFAIAIRTMLYKPRSDSGGEVTLRAGAGIVYDSLPRHENLECHNKARAPLSSL